MTVKRRPSMVEPCRPLVSPQRRAAARNRPRAHRRRAARARRATHHFLSSNSSSGRTPMSSACAAVAPSRRRGARAPRWRCSCGWGSCRCARGPLRGSRARRRDTPPRHAAVAQRQPSVRGATTMLAPKLSRLFCASTRQRRAQREQRHHRGDADQQPGDQERGARLAAAQVAEGDGAQLHGGAPRDGGRRSSGQAAALTGSTARRPAESLVGMTRSPPLTVRSIGDGLQPPSTSLICVEGKRRPQLLQTISSPSCW